MYDNARYIYIYIQMETTNRLWNWLKQNTTSLGDGVKIYNKNNQDFNANVFITRERYPLDCSRFKFVWWGGTWKEITDCKCEWHMNPCVKNADLSSMIILKLSWRTYTAKDYNGFNLVSFFGRYIYSILDFPNWPSGIKIGYKKNTSSNSLLCGI